MTELHKDTVLVFNANGGDGSKNILTEMLRDMGFQTIFAKSENQFSFAYSCLPHIKAIIIEKNKVKRRFKEWYEKVRIPVILTTDKEEKNKTKFDFHIKKPFSECALNDVLTKIGLRT